MAVEGIGPKIFYYTAIARLKTLRTFTVEDDVDEFHLTELLRAEPLLFAGTPVRVYRERIFNDVGLAAKYELEMLEAFRNPYERWEWTTISKGLGSMFFNISLWKRESVLVVIDMIIRTGQNEWRVYKVEPLEGEKE